jgi:predicted HicB family RNase H-like nuclease
MKTQKRKRSFRCTDSVYSAVEEAAKQDGMSVNEWIVYAIRTQLKEGVAGGDPVDLDKVGELAKANSMDKLTAAIERSQRVFAETRKELGLD